MRWENTLNHDMHLIDLTRALGKLRRAQRTRCVRAVGCLQPGVTILSLNYQCSTPRKTAGTSSLNAGQAMCADHVEPLQLPQAAQSCEISISVLHRAGHSLVTAAGTQSISLLNVSRPSKAQDPCPALLSPRWLGPLALGRQQHPLPTAGLGTGTPQADELPSFLRASSMS